jgi:rod shape-determining protein MreD
MKKLTFYLLTLFGILWIQMASNFFLGASGLSANIVLVIVLYFGLAQGPLAGEVMGFLWGLMIDASTLGLMGQHALLYSGAGFLSGLLRRQLDEKKVWTQTIFSLGISVFYLILYFLIERIFSQGPRAWSITLVAQPVINAIIAPLFFWLMQHWSEIWDISRVET